jgi:acyl-CoA thioesterase-1
MTFSSPSQIILLNAIFACALFIQSSLITSLAAHPQQDDPKQAQPKKKDAAKKDAAKKDSAKKDRPPNPVLLEIEDDPKLPRVLLIGDSISMGYTLHVRKLLEGKANVHRPLTNCGPTTKGVAELEKWLGEKPWDVIHFNFGLHDLKYLQPNSENLADPNAADSKPQVSLEDYEKNLRCMVAKLKETKAVLIWRSTTPVPAGAQGRIPEDAVKYNQVAAQVMQENGITIDDMYAYSLEKLKEIQIPKNVHFKPAGSRFLAERVSQEILKALQSKSE